MMTMWCFFLVSLTSLFWRFQVALGCLTGKGFRQVAAARAVAWLTAKETWWFAEVMAGHAVRNRLKT
jgi:hypothetical protein